MEHFWEQVVDDAQQRCGQVSCDFSWTVAARQDHLEEPGRSRYVAPLRHRHADDQRREALHPPVDGDAINVDAAFGEEFFDVSV